MVSSPMPLSIHQLSGGAAVRSGFIREDKNVDFMQDGFRNYIFFYNQFIRNLARLLFPARQKPPQQYFLFLTV